MKRFRQAAILDLVAREALASQDALRHRLRARGFEATQATISRDIKALRLVKRASDGAYQRPGPEAADHGSRDTRTRRIVAEYLRTVDCVQQLLVLKTEAGQASPLALAIDRAELGEVVGTVAGDDTILVITRTAASARGLARLLERWAKE